MDQLPNEILDKIHGYVSDLFFQDHAKKFKRTLTSILRIHDLYIRCRISFLKTRRWKIQCHNGVYDILRYSGDRPTHWVHVYKEVIDGTIPMSIGSEWYTLLTSF